MNSALYPLINYWGREREKEPKILSRDNFEMQGSERERERERERRIHMTSTVLKEKSVQLCEDAGQK